MTYTITITYTIILLLQSSILLSITVNLLVCLTFKLNSITGVNA